VRDASLDLVVSKSVLEHVRPRDVDPLLKEVARVLRPGGRTVHIIDLRDHLHIEGDEGVSGDWLEALRYPEWLYRAMFSNRSTSINRLRRTQWIDRFERAGLGVVRAQTVTFPLSPGFDAAALQPPWSDMGEEELRVGILTVAATRPSS
jgi:SAM-dependent methyltransferase